MRRVNEIPDESYKETVSFRSHATTIIILVFGKQLTNGFHGHGHEREVKLFPPC